MSKEVTWVNVDEVWFTVEIFKVRNFNTIVEDLEIKDHKYHGDNELFIADTISDAVTLAKQLLSRDDDYNYALIYLNRYNEDPEISTHLDDEDEINDYILIGDVWNETLGWEDKDDSNSEG